LLLLLLLLVLQKGPTTADDDEDDKDDEDDEEGEVLESNKTSGLRTAGWELPKTSWSENVPLPRSRGT